MKRAALLVAGLLFCAPAFAADRNYSVTDFDRVRVIGPFKVDLETGKAPSARATGSALALERIDVRVQGRILIISTNRNAWGGWSGATPPPATVRVTVPMLREATIDGSGSLSVSRMKGLRLTLAQQGASRLTVGTVETDRLDMGLIGAGQLTVSGKAKQIFVTGRGASGINAAALDAQDIQLTWESAGEASFMASRTAKITATGSGNVTITGKAACTVTAVGNGQVICGDGANKPAG